MQRQECIKGISVREREGGCNDYEELKEPEAELMQLV